MVLVPLQSAPNSPSMRSSSLTLRDLRADHTNQDETAKRQQLIKLFFLNSLFFTALVLLLPQFAYGNENRPSAPDKMPADVDIKLVSAIQHEDSALRQPPEGERSDVEEFPMLDGVDLKGWDYLFSLLVREGIEPSYAIDLLTDKRMPKRTTIYFKLKPRESKHLYRKHNSARKRRNALRFYRQNYRFFEEAYAKFGVSKSVMLAILQVETNCGSYTGRARTFHGLARLSTVRDPENLKANYELAANKNKNVTLADFEARGKWLEQEFLPHVVATIELTERMGIHPLDLRGSSAGAIGIPQFLPGNVERFGHDGNGDKVVDLFDPADAIPSVAKYLNIHGWLPHKTMLTSEKRDVIWAYNRSDSYIDTVLKMSAQLEKGIEKSDKEIKRSLQELL